MKPLAFPAPDAVETAIEWLRANEGGNGEAARCHVVAAWLERQLLEQLLARERGVPVAPLRRKLQEPQRERERALKLAEQLIEIGPEADDEGLLLHAQRIRDRLKTPMSEVLEKVPGTSITEKAKRIGITPSVLRLAPWRVPAQLRAIKAVGRSDRPQRRRHSRTTPTKWRLKMGRRERSGSPKWQTR